MPDETAADMDVGESSGGGDPLVRCEFEDEVLHEALAVEEDAAAMAEFFEASASLLKSIMLSKGGRPRREKKKDVKDEREKGEK